LSNKFALAYPTTSSINEYRLSSAFTFDFKLKIPHTTGNKTDSYVPGTIFHNSSSYALSIITGSSRDSRGFPDKFRLQLQLSHSAGYPPDNTTPSGSLADLTFLSADNSLERNKWHHVSVGWDSTRNNSSGTFYIDLEEKGKFGFGNTVTHGISSNDILFVGNFFEGSNPENFFNTTATTNHGTPDLNPAGSDPIHNFNYGLNAEIHDLKIYNRAINSIERINNSKSGQTNIVTSSLVFYLPPFFVKESPPRRVFRTPFVFEDGATTDSPFNVDYSFSTAGRMINLENFLRDMSTGKYPIPIGMTGSVITAAVDTNLTANDYTYLTSSLIRRNMMILPCDDGNFVPNFKLLSTGSVIRDFPSTGSLHGKFVNDLGILDFSKISLNNMINKDNFLPGLTAQSGSVFNDIIKITPTVLSGSVSDISYPAVYQRTRDNSSNEIVIFDVSNLYFGNRIEPGTFKIKDTSVTGSSGKMTITLKDDGYGNIYRADADSSNAKWNSVGNIFYDEGFVLIKSPNLPFFGKDAFEVEFNGTQNIHTMKINTLAPSNMVNSSSNYSFLNVSASLDVNDNDPNFVYITGINFHDENLNVIMRTKLSQPVIKRHGDKILFRSKIDF